MADQPEQYGPPSNLPIESAPDDYTALPTEGVDDPAYAAAVRGENLNLSDPNLTAGEYQPQDQALRTDDAEATERYNQALRRGLSEAEAQEEGWPTEEARTRQEMSDFHELIDSRSGVLSGLDDGTVLKTKIAELKRGLQSKDPTTQNQADAMLRQIGEDLDQVDTTDPEVERIVQEARENLARTPDGVEGDLEAPEDTRRDALVAALAQLSSDAPPAGTTDFEGSSVMEAQRVGIGFADFTEYDGETYQSIAVLLEADGPEGLNLPPIRIARYVGPLDAVDIAMQLLDHSRRLVRKRAAEDEADAERADARDAKAEDEAAAAPDAPQALDTEE